MKAKQLAKLLMLHPEEEVYIPCMDWDIHPVIFVCKGKKLRGNGKYSFETFPGILLDSSSRMWYKKWVEEVEAEEILL